MGQNREKSQILEKAIQALHLLILISSELFCHPKSVLTVLWVTRRDFMCSRQYDDRVVINSHCGLPITRKGWLGMFPRITVLEPCLPHCSTRNDHLIFDHCLDLRIWMGTWLSGCLPWTDLQGRFSLSTRLPRYMLGNDNTMTLYSTFVSPLMASGWLGTGSEDVLTCRTFVSKTLDIRPPHACSSWDWISLK